MGRDGASVDAAVAVDRAPGVCASVMMPAVSDMRASSVEVPGNFWEKAGVRAAPQRMFGFWEPPGTEAFVEKLEGMSHTGTVWDGMFGCVGSAAVTPCMALPQALVVANVECVTAMPTARAERVSAAGR